VFSLLSKYKLLLKHLALNYFSSQDLKTLFMGTNVQRYDKWDIEGAKHTDFEFF